EVMKQSIFTNYDLSEDGHPCEAALEFRRLAIRNGIVGDLSINSLDLAISFAWAGKAISRTRKLDSWMQAGVDPNSLDIIRAMSLDAEVRRDALKDARNAQAVNTFASSLHTLRKSTAFQRAMTSVGSTLSSTRSDTISMLVELAYVAKRLPGWDIKPEMTRTNNLVRLDSYRKKRTS